MCDGSGSDQRNPMTVRLPTGEKVPAEYLDSFQSQVELVEREVLATGNFRFAAMELLPNERGQTP